MEMPEYSTRWPMNHVAYYCILGAIFVGGLLMVIVPHWLEWSWDKQIIPELGKALIITSVLGFTIEPSLRKALARNVFAAAFGYLMPEDVREQLIEIASQRLLCIEHRMNVSITYLDTDYVKVTVSAERVFKNVGVSPMLHGAMTWVDEWGNGNTSKILRCEVTSVGGKRKENVST
jgi:hypothetical protein